MGWPVVSIIDTTNLPESLDSWKKFKGILFLGRTRSWQDIWNVDWREQEYLRSNFSSEGENTEQFSKGWEFRIKLLTNHPFSRIFFNFDSEILVKMHTLPRIFNCSHPLKIKCSYIFHERRHGTFHSQQRDIFFNNDHSKRHKRTKIIKMYVSFRVHDWIMYITSIWWANMNSPKGYCRSTSKPDGYWLGPFVIVRS